jgi:hypothetical protein
MDEFTDGLYDLMNQIKRDVLTEAFSNFTYVLPSDPEKILYDFYFFTFGAIETRADDKFNYAIQEAKDTVCKALQKHMLKAVRFAIACELRHFERPDKMSRISAKTKKFVESYGKLRTGRMQFEEGLNLWETMSRRETKKYQMFPGESANLAGRKRSYEAVIKVMREQKLDDHDFGEIAEEMFSRFGWDSGYGGRAWAKIARGFWRLADAKSTNERSVWIDHVYDLQHNNNTVFDKLQTYYKGSEGVEWLKRALDWKRDVKDIRDFYEKVSPQLNPIVAYVAKNIYGTTMEKTGQWEGGTYKMKKWLGGTWHKGIWQGGIWEDGTWKDGMWIAGIWKKGTWEDGTWMSGTWEDGTWEDGKWKSGTWKGGTWKKGKIYTRNKGWVESKVDPATFFKQKGATKK